MLNSGLDLSNRKFPVYEMTGVFIDSISKYQQKAVEFFDKLIKRDDK